MKLYAVSISAYRLEPDEGTNATYDHIAFYVVARGPKDAKRRVIAAATKAGKFPPTTHGKHSVAVCLIPGINVRTP